MLSSYNFARCDDGDAVRVYHWCEYRFFFVCLTTSLLLSGMVMLVGFLCFRLDQSHGSFIFNERGSMIPHDIAL